MNDMTALEAINFETATLADLDSLTMDDILGENIGDISLSQSLPDGVYIGVIEKKEMKSRAADIEAGKKAGLSLTLSVKIVKCLQLADASGNPEDYTGKYHFQRFPVHVDFGKQNVVKMILGAVGVSYTDKNAIAEVAGSIAALLEQLITEKVAFGFTVVNKEADGYENSDMVFKQPSFINAEAAQEQLD